jgi:methyl-accepting chemotaxis protein
MKEKVDRMSVKMRKTPPAIFAGAVTEIMKKCRGITDAGNWAAIRNKIVRGLSRGKMKELSDQITAVSGALQASVENESDFLEMGRRLQSVYTDTTELVRHIQDAIKEVMGDADDNVLSKSGDMAKRAETALARRRERVALSLPRIREVADHQGGLHQACDNLGRIAMNLRVVALNIGVESTRTAEGREMFTVVSQEILQLSEKFDAIANCIREDATTAMTEQMQAFGTISSGLKELDGLTAEASCVVSAAVNETEKGVAAFLKAFETADARFQEISNRVGEIVMGLQFHDNMRQRIEHITDALDDSGRIFRGSTFEKGPAASEKGGETVGTGDQRSETLERACSAVTLQKVQLADVITEIKRVHRESTAAFGEIGREIKEIGGIMSAVSADIHGAADGDEKTLSDPFSKLTVALTGLNELLKRSDALDGRIEESVSKVSEMGHRFSVHLSDVDAISFETKIKALNAIVKAGHMSAEGSTLEVLAQEMNRLSAQTNEFVAGVEDKLKKVGAFGDSIRESGEEFRDGGGSKGMSETVAEGIGEIARMGDLMNVLVDKVSEKADALGVMVAQTVSELGFLATLADDMTDYLDALGAQENRLGTLAEKWKAGGASDAEKLTESYTMQRERMIHDTVFSTEKESPDAATNPDDAGADTDDDVSLWEEDGEESGSGGDTSLWGDEEAGPGKPLPEKEEDDGQFGDNVELF